MTDSCITDLFRNHNYGCLCVSVSLRITRMLCIFGVGTTGSFMTDLNPAFEYKI